MNFVVGSRWLAERTPSNGQIPLLPSLRAVVERSRTIPNNDQRDDYFYSPMQIITLNKGREQSILRKHPWIFSRAIETIPKGLHDGDVVQVQDSEGNVLGVGHFQDSSLAV